MTDYSIKLPSVSVKTVPVKIVGLADSSEEKNLEYYQNVLKKKQQYEFSKAQKIQGLIPPSEEEIRDAEEYERISNLNSTFLDSYRRNKDAWFSNRSFVGQTANKLLGIGTSAISDIGLGVAKTPFAVSNLINRARINDDEYQYSKSIIDKQNQGIPLTPEDKVWTKSEAFTLSKNILDAKQVTQQLDELGLRIKSVVNTLPTDMAQTRITQFNKQTIDYFKEGTPESVLNGLGSFFKGIYRLATEDTNAAIQYAADSLPYMLSFVLAPQAAIPVYAINIHEEAMQEFEQEYGRLPNKTEQAFSVALSTLSASLDALGSKVTLQGKGALKSILDAAKATGIKTTTKPILNITKNLTKTGLELGEAVVTEAATEAGQEALENLAAKQDLSKISSQQVLTAGTIGGAVGGAMATPATTIKATSTPDVALKEQKFNEYKEISKDYVNTPEAKINQKTGFTGKVAVDTLQKIVKLEDSKDKIEFTKATITEFINALDNDTGKNAKEILGILHESELDKNISTETISILERLAKVDENTIKSKIAKKLPVAENLVEKGKRKNKLENIIQGKIDIYSRDNKTWSTKEKQKFRRDIQKDINILTDEVNILPESTPKEEAIKSSKEKAIIKYQTLLQDITGIHTKVDISNLSTQEIEKHTQKLVNAEEKIQTTTSTLKKDIKKFIKTGNEDSKKIIFGSMSNFLLDKEDAITLKKAKVFKENSKEATQLNEYIEAITFPEVTNQIQYGKGKNQFTKGLNFYIDNLTTAFINKDRSSAKRNISNLVSWYNHHSTKAERGDIYSKNVIAQNKKEYELMADIILNANKRYKTVFKNEFNISPQYLKHYNGKLIKGLTAAQLGSRIINKGIKQAIKNDRVKEPPPIQEHPRENIKKAIKTTSEAISKQIKGKVPIKEEKPSERLKIPPEAKELNKVHPAEKYREEYVKQLNSVEESKVLSSTQLKELNSTVKIFTNKTKNLTNPIVGKAISLINIANNKTNTLLRSRLFKDPITINTTKSGSGSGLIYAKNLKELVVPKKGIVSTLFQEMPDLLNKSINEIATVLNIPVTDFSKNEVKALDYLNTMYNYMDNLFNGSNSILRDINSKNVKGKSTAIPYDLDIAIRDVTSYLIQEDTVNNRYIDSDLVGMFAAVAMEWVVTQGQSTLFNDQEALEKLTGLTKENFYGTDIVKELQRAGTPRVLVERMLGNKLFDMLDWKINPEYRNNEWIVAKLKIALGQLVTTGLLAGNILKENKVEMDRVLGKMQNESTQTYEFKDTKFLQLQNKDYEVLPHIQEIINTFIDGPKAKQGINLLHDKLNMESYKTGPIFNKPKKKTNRIISGTFREVSKETNTFMNHEEASPWKISIDMLNLHNIFDLNYQTLMMGGKDPSKEHISQQIITAETNINLTRQFQQIENFVEDLKHLENTFYFLYEQWKSGRIGIKSNTINPISSKFHRAIISKASWFKEVDMNNSEHYQYISTAIAQSLGINIEQHFSDIEIQLKAKLQDPVIINAIKIIQKSRTKSFSGKFTSKQQESILEAVELGGEKYHTLKGLLELSKFTQRVTTKTVELKLKKNIKVSTDLWVEIDGKTNGIAFSLFQAGFGKNGTLDNITKHTLNACGILYSGYPDYATYKDNPFNRDIYEMVTDVALKEMLSKENLPIINALSIFIDPFYDEDLTISSAGRKFSKGSVIRSNFGQSNKTNIIGVIDENIQAIYKYQATLQNKAINAWEVITYVSAIRLLTGNNKFTLDPKNAVTQEFEYKDLKVIEANIEQALGKSLVNALDYLFGGINLYKDALNKGASLLFRMFEIKLNKAIKIKQKEIWDKTHIERALMQDEIKEILDKMPEILPAYKGPHSDALKNNLFALTIAKAKKYNTADANQQFYSQGINNTIYSTKNTSKKAHSTVSHLPVISLRDAGIKTLIMMIHHLDSTVQQRILMQQDALGIHDAKIEDIFSLQDSGQKYNKIFKEINEEYHGLTELLKRIKEVMENGNLEKNEIYNINTNISKDILFFKTIDEKSTFPIKTTFNNIREVVNYLERINEMSIEARQDILNTTLNYDQYIGGNSSYSEILNTISEKYIKQNIDNYITEYGSSPDTSAIDLNNFDTIYEADVTPFTTQLIFDQLSKYEVNKESPKHTIHLQHLITDLINGVITPMDQIKVKLEEKGELNRGKILDNKDIYLKIAPENPALQIGQSARSIWLHEMIHAITAEAIEINPTIRRQIFKIKRIAEKNIKWEEFLEIMDGEIKSAVSEKAEKFVARELWEYIFGGEKSIHEFMAHGLTNEKFRNKLQQIIIKSESKKSENILEAIANLWNKIIETLTNLFYGIQNKDVATALENLVFKLTKAKDKQIAGMKYKATFRDTIDPKFKKVLTQYIFEPYIKLSEKYLRHNKFIILKGLSLPAEIARLINHKDFYLMIEEVKRRIGLTHDNFITKLIREIFIGETPDNSRWHNLLRNAKKILDQARQQKAKIIKDYIKGNFLTGLSEHTSESIHRTLIKNDVSSIIDRYIIEEGVEKPAYTYTLDQLTDFLFDKNLLKKEIDSVEQDILKGKEQAKKYYAVQAANLGLFMATGKTKIAEANLNTHNIVNMYGVDGKLKKIIQDEKLIKRQVDTLATLYGLFFTNTEDKFTTGRKIKLEIDKNVNKNGITSLLDSHKSTKQLSYTKLFNQDPSLMIKGYHSAILNPKIDIQVAPLSDKLLMEKNGYQLYGDQPLIKDNADTNPVKLYLYVTKENALYSRVRTIVSITNKLHKGHDQTQIYEALGDAYPYISGHMATEEIQAYNYNAIKEQMNTVMDITKQSGNFLVPIRNKQGGTAGYRYMMKHDLMRNLFEQEERVEEVMAATEASIIDKEKTEEINIGVVNAAYDDYQENIGKIPSHFKLISLDSPDGEKYTELYKLLPEDMKQYMELKWGNKGMMIREEFIDLIFGFRKASLYDAKIMGKEIGHIINDSLKWFLDAVGKAFPKINYTGTLPLKALEDKIQDAVKLAKDLIVVKSGQVLVDNMISNTILLWIKGVPIKDVFAKQKEAFNAINDYRNILDEKELLEQQLLSETYRISTIKQRNLQKKIDMLDAELKANPAHDLIQEGLFQSIIEDIDIDEKSYNTSSKLAKFTEDWGNKHLPDLVMTGAKYAWISKDTPLYKLLFKLTQYGDFIARYTLYKHREKQQRLNKLHKESDEYRDKKQEILREVVDTFINYDVPTSPELQYLNDMGIMMFTKFLFRIQRIIFKTFKENPASSLAFLLMQHVTGFNPADINESAFFSGLLYRLGTPFNPILQLLQVPIINIRGGSI